MSLKDDYCEVCTELCSTLSSIGISIYELWTTAVLTRDNASCYIHLIQPVAYLRSAISGRQRSVINNVEQCNIKSER